MENLASHCPHCDTERSFYLTASTTVHLGTKTKWCCPECGYKFVRIDDDVDTSTTA